MFLLVAGRAQSRGRADEPIRTQRDSSRSQDQPVGTRRSKRRSEKESDSSTKYPPIIVGPLTTNQDLINATGEKIYNLPLMIQQPFLREKKEPIKVDISVKLIPKPKKKDKKKREAQIEEIVIQAEEEKGVRNSISMEVVDGNIQVLNETVEVIDSEKASKGEGTQEAKEPESETKESELEVQQTKPADETNEAGEPLPNVKEIVNPQDGESEELLAENLNTTSEPTQESNVEVAENETESNAMETEEQRQPPDIEIDESQSIQGENENAKLDDS